jgi:hypothetical protein
VHDAPLWPDFRAATQVNIILDSVVESYEKKAWVEVEQYDVNR